MMMARKMTGKRWGLKPRNMEWVYTSIVRPILSYGSIAWLPRINGKGTQKQLEKIQRKACLMITRGIQSTPTAGMETILGLTPLHIHCKGVALKSYLRIEKHGQWRPRTGEILGKNTHAKLIQEMISQLPKLAQPTSKLTQKAFLGNNFEILIEDREVINQKGKIRPRPLTVN